MNMPVGNQAVNTKLFLSIILPVILILSFYTPFPLINSDSVHGFEVMNGYYWTGKWNTTVLFDENTHLLYEKFLTWWSPGQWLVPMFFIKVFHLKIGSALVLINFLCTSLGTIGYFLVFKKYGFDRSVIWISVTGILLSSPVLPGFYYYAGGECLNFMIFPWIIVMQGLLLRKFWKFIFPGFILFISFLCKLQMLIVVPPLLFLLLFTQKEDLNFGSRPRLRNYLPLFISVIPILLLVYFSFISNGDTPLHSVKQFSPNLVNFLFPVASPFISVYFFDTLHYFLSRNSILEGVYLFIMSVILILCMAHVLRHFNENEPVKKKYIFLAFILYIVSVCVFIVLYTRGTSIDLNARHLKLTSFLLYPVFFELLLKRFKRAWVLVLLGLLGVFAVGNHIRLVRKWTQGTSITRSGFSLFKQDMPLGLKSKLDSLVKTKTVVISPYGGRYAVDNQLILPILSKVDIRPDLTPYGYPIIFTDSLSNH